MPAKLKSLIMCSAAQTPMPVCLNRLSFSVCDDVLSEEVNILALMSVVPLEQLQHVDVSECSLC